MARENCGLLAVPRTVPAQLMQSAGQVQYAFSQRPALLIQLWNPKDNYGISASVYVVQFNGFMSLIC